MNKFDTILNSFFVSYNESFNVFDTGFAIFLPFLICFLVSYTYRNCYQGNNYQNEFVHSIFIFSMIIGFITLIIGNNIARAFGLVGALSLIRFRTALKSINDTMYIFWALAIGMACGSGFYIPALLFSVVLSACIFFLYYFKIGKNKSLKIIAKLKVPKSENKETLILVMNLLASQKISSNLINQQFHSTNDEVFFNYELILNDSIDLTTLESSLNEITGVSEVLLYNHESSKFL